MKTDIELLERYAHEGSQAAFAELVERHLGLVYATALRHVGGDAHLAEDVAQRVFNDLARKAARLTRHRALAGWLYLGAHHAAAQVVRADRRRRQREQEAHAMQELLPEMSASDWERVRPLIDDALRALSEADREAVLLRFFACRSFAAIGSELAVTEDAARMRVDRALEKIRVLLARRGVTSTSAALATALAAEAVASVPAGLAGSLTSAALAGAAGGTTTASAGFFAMNTPIIVSGALACLALGGLAFQTQQLHRAEERLTTLAKERATLQARLSDLQTTGRAFADRAAAAEQTAATLQRELEATRARITAATTLPATGAPALTARTNGPQGQLTLMNFTPDNADPAEARRRVRDYNLEGRELGYRSFYPLAGFTPAQIEQFRALLAQWSDRSQQQIDAAMRAARAQTPPPDRPALQAVLQAAAQASADEWQAIVRTNFGDAVAATLARYNDTRPVRTVTKELSGALFDTDAPLSPAQAERLVDIMAAHSRNAAGKVDLAAMNAEAIMAEAAAVLSPAQLTVFRRAQADIVRRWVPTTAKAPGN